MHGRPFAPNPAFGIGWTPVLVASGLTLVGIGGVVAGFLARRKALGIRTGSTDDLLLEGSVVTPRPGSRLPGPGSIFAPWSQRPDDDGEEPGTGFEGAGGSEPVVMPKGKGGAFDFGPLPEGQHPVRIALRVTTVSEPPFETGGELELELEQAWTATVRDGQPLVIGGGGGQWWANYGTATPRQAQGPVEYAPQGLPTLDLIPLGGDRLRLVIDNPNMQRYCWVQRVASGLGSTSVPRCGASHSGWSVTQMGGGPQGQWQYFPVRWEGDLIWSIS